MSCRRVTDLAILEVIACRESIAFAIDMNLQRVHIATACLNVVNDIATFQGGKYEVVIKDINASRSAFTLYFVHEKRGSNYKAHNLARFASTLDQRTHTLLGLPHDTLCIPMIINQ